MRICAGCGNPTQRNPWATFCFSCLRERELIFAKISSKKYNASPKGKLTKYKYDQKFHPQRKERQRQWYARTHPSLGEQIRACATERCAGTFIYGRWKGRRKFCDDCRKLFDIRSRAA